MVVTFICARDHTPHVARGRETLQMYGFPVIVCSQSRSHVSQNHSGSFGSVVIPTHCQWYRWLQPSQQIIVPSSPLPHPGQITDSLFQVPTIKFCKSMHSCMKHNGLLATCFFMFLLNCLVDLEWLPMDRVVSVTL